MTPSATSYAEIPLTQGQVAIIDAADFEVLIRFKWQARRDLHTNTFYAQRSVYIGGGRANRKNVHVSMHRQILGLEADDKRHADHINGDTLDNRRANLRVTTSQQNTWNQKRRSTNNSGFRGVTWYARDKKWRAVICVRGKYISLGLHASPELASAAYTEAAKIHYGEFSRP